MSKRSPNLGVFTRITFLVLLGLLIFGGFGGLVLLFYAPIMGWFVWRLMDRVSELEKKVAELEKKP